MLRYSALVLAAGCLYGAFVARTGLAVPCLFRLITGWKCPGCGVTQMCVSLLCLDFAGAYSSNPMLFVLSPFLAVTGFCYLSGYVRDGGWKPGRVFHVFLYLCIGLLLVYGVLRNL